MKIKSKLSKKVLLLPFFVILFFFLFNKSYKSQSENSNNIVQNLETTLTIEGITDSSPIDISGLTGKTALEATAISLNNKIETKGEGVNAYVISINGKEADSEKNEFWELSINGKPSEVGAGSYIISQGDKIVWKINTF